MTLDEIGIEAGTDKSSRLHNYLHFYERHLGALRNDKFFFLEIGVYRGNSLAAWGGYFRNATVVGVDIDPEANVAITCANTRIRIGDGTSPVFLDAVLSEFGTPLVVLDDGSHFWHHQIDAFEHLWPKLQPGGTYIVEDLHTSFPEYARDPLYRGTSKVSAFDYLIKLNTWLVGNRAMAGAEAELAFVRDQWPWVESMHWFRGTCIIQKGASPVKGSPLKNMHMPD